MLTAEERDHLRYAASRGVAWNHPRLSERVLALLADLEAAECENAALRAFILKVEAAAQDWNHAMDADAFASEARALRGGKEGS